MKAFVKVRNGNFPDVNYYMAWKGFNDIGYEVVKFEEAEQDTIEVSEETPVFAGVGSCRKIIKRVWGWDYVGINPYPTELTPYMRRKVERKKWLDARKEALEGHMFIKPVIQKQFTGTVLNTLLDTIRTGKMEEDHEVFVCEPVKFVSEFRVYVHEHEIVGVKHYFSEEDWGYQYAPYIGGLKEMIAAYKPSAPIAYGMDVGMIFKPTWTEKDKAELIAAGECSCHLEGGNYVNTLVEINDGICLGNYGLDPIHYAEMISSRWLELTTKGSV